MLYIASDHAGWKTKEHLKKYLDKKHVKYEDLSSKKYNPHDHYPEFAQAVAKKVLKEKGSFGVLVCDSGAGMLVAANRFKGIRATLLLNNWTTLRARKHEDANVAVFGEELTKPRTAAKLLGKFLRLDFSSADRHRKRIKMLDA